MVRGEWNESRNPIGRFDSNATDLPSGKERGESDESNGWRINWDRANRVNEMHEQQSGFQNGQVKSKSSSTRETL